MKINLTDNGRNCSTIESIEQLNAYIQETAKNYRILWSDLFLWNNNGKGVSSSTVYLEQIPLDKLTVIEPEQEGKSETVIVSAQHLCVTFDEVWKVEIKRGFQDKPYIKIEFYNDNGSILEYLAYLVSNKE